MPRHRLTALLLLLAAGCSHPAVEKVETEAAVPVTVEPARMDTITSVIAVTGTVVPAPGADWTIVAPAAARIAELPKVEGDVVHAGDVLVRFEIPSLPADLGAREAEVAQAQARLDLAKASVARNTGLVTQGVASRRELEEAKQQQADAEAALAQAQGAVRAATMLADRAIVKATFDGVIARRWHNAGDLVDASASDPILRVINPRQLQVVAAVPMSALARVVVGRAAKVTGPGGADEAATVQARPIQVDPASATADVRLGFTTMTHLPAGSVVDVAIVAETRPNVLVVPTVAIVYEEGEIFVMVAGDDNRAHKYPVVLGLASHELTEIKNGLKPGANVIVRGQEGLPDGGTIQVQK